MVDWNAVRERNRKLREYVDYLVYAANFHDEPDYGDCRTCERIDEAEQALLDEIGEG